MQNEQHKPNRDIPQAPPGAAAFVAGRGVPAPPVQAGQRPLAPVKGAPAVPAALSGPAGAKPAVPVAGATPQSGAAPSPQPPLQSGPGAGTLHRATGGPPPGEYAPGATHEPAAPPWPAAHTPPNKLTTQRKRSRKRATGQSGALVTLVFALGLLLCGLLLSTGLNLSERVPPVQAGRPALAVSPPEQEEALSTAEIVAKVAPSVVSIDLYEENSLSAGSSGSGIVLSSDGYIATNAHVVHGMPVIRVVLHDGSGYTATLVGMEPASDLAVLKIDAAGLTPARLGDSNAAQVGERVLTIGNATGTLPGSVTQGILSGVGRDVPLSTVGGEVVRMRLLQTDAAINPGNSGGALVDAFGRVIGINVGKMEKENVENVGFAIPISDAMPVLQRLLDEQPAPAVPLLGVTVLALNETTGPPLGLPGQGLYIVEIGEQSHLHSFGIAVGDVIVKADGQPLRDTLDLSAAVQRHLPGEEIELEIYRQRTGTSEVVRAVLYEDASAGEPASSEADGSEA